MVTIRVEMESLFCESGNHKWQRPKTRGAKPRSCPDHKPVTTYAPSGKKADSLQTLHCQIGNHTWQRPSARGVKPLSCPEHKTAKATPNRRANPGEAAEPDTLTCVAGNHTWQRPAARGRKPANCPAHSTVGPRNVPVRIISENFPAIQEVPEEELPLVEVEGEYESETTEDEQRELLTAAFNPPPKKRGRPQLYANEEEQREAELKRSREKTDALEAHLKERGTHISQQAPYSLYKLVRGNAGQKDAKYDFVRLFSPLAKAQFISQFSDRFDAGTYYFEKDGQRIDE